MRGAPVRSFARTHEQHPTLPGPRTGCRQGTAAAAMLMEWARFRWKFVLASPAKGALEQLGEVVPRRLASSAARTASFIWPRICGSPSTMESRPLATRKAWRAASHLSGRRCGIARHRHSGPQNAPASAAWVRVRGIPRRNRFRYGCRWRQWRPRACAAGFGAGRSGCDLVHGKGELAAHVQRRAVL